MTAGAEVIRQAPGELLVVGEYVVLEPGYRLCHRAAEAVRGVVPGCSVVVARRGPGAWLKAGAER